VISLLDYIIIVVNTKVIDDGYHDWIIKNCRVGIRRNEDGSVVEEEEE
jgi:hypothetical protein